MAEALGIARGVLVDCSHGSSGKDASRQGPVCRDVLAQARAGQPSLLGVALESHLRPGSQPWRPGARLAFGVSITDACIGWEETERLLLEVAEAATARG
jgi:3-deoxy-7-phosphoheptulonate synthase